MKHNNIQILLTSMWLVVVMFLPQFSWAQNSTQPNGSGSEADPYIIRTADDLAWFRDQVNSGQTAICAKIADDVEVIDMSTVCHAADATNNIGELSWEPFGDGKMQYDGTVNGNSYQGTFDGNGKTISGLYINASQNYMGLFGYIDHSTIKNLTLEYAKVTNTGNIEEDTGSGILVGAANESTLQNIKISSTCQIHVDKAFFAGGIAGMFIGNAYNCVNDAAVHGVVAVGGLFGAYTGNYLTTCANYGDVTATYFYAGGLVGFFYSGTIQACANYGKVTSEGMIAGGLVGNFESGTIQDCANYGYVEGVDGVAGMVGMVESGKIQNVFSYGSIKATKTEEPISIGMAIGASSKGATTEGMVAYYSGATLTANDQVQNAQAFGNGYPSEDNATGFTEDQLKSGVVAFLLQENASSKAKWGQNLATDGDIYPVIGSEHQVYADHVTLNCKTNEVVEGSFANNTTSSDIKYIHGQAVHHTATAASCTEAGAKEYWQCQDCQRTYSDEQLTEKLTDVTKPALGHINNDDGYCSRCQHYVAVKPSLENGVYQIAKPCHLAWFRDYVNGTIVDEGEKAGTIHPSAAARLTENINLKNYCHAANDTINIKELSWEPIGNEKNPYKGIFDGNGNTISYLYINASQFHVGLFGYTNKSTIKNLTLDSAKVTNTGDYTGFLVGYANGTLQNIKISNTYQINGDDKTGGIAGHLEGNAYNCVNYATVQGYDDVGGLFGYYQGDSITACANYGDVTATHSFVGGLVGDFKGGMIHDCANYGKVEGYDYVAGMAGYVIEGKIQNVFSYGNITATINTQEVGMAFGDPGNGTAEGMVAYYSGATLTINGQEQTAKAFGSGNLLEDNATGFTEAQLLSGEVAWLLNGSKSASAEGKTLAWYQKLGKDGDKYPVLTRKDGNTVYYSDCICVDTPVKTYSNTENETFDRHNKGTETPSTNGLYSSTCQRCQTNFMYIKDFCGIKGNDLELTDDHGKYIAKAVTLTDGEAYNSPVDIEVTDFKYARTYVANKWQPLYVPFAMSVDQWTDKGLTVASINNFHEMKLKSGATQVLLKVKKVTSGSLEPNVPYLILCEAGGESLLELGAATLSKAEEDSIDCHSVTRNYVFHGKYSTMSGFGASGEKAIYYGVKDGEMVLLTAEDVIGPQNWYLTVTNRPNLYGIDDPLTSAAVTFSIHVIGDGEPTGIEDIHVVSDEAESGKQGIFDLQGRQLNAEPTHGIYIKNGKKYVK